mmetsp:Transcript_21578/g.28417  ORF Transcript_21578/g.28417 Transcript_21578/m.28417 type:complete len:80 (+) Transcript_21578:534-773(+)
MHGSMHVFDNGSTLVWDNDEFPVIPARRRGTIISINVVGDCRSTLPTANPTCSVEAAGWGGGGADGGGPAAASPSGWVA